MDEARRRRIRRNALLLALLPLAFFLAFYLAQLARSAG
jgi:hypothetical protein